MEHPGPALIFTGGAGPGEEEKPRGLAGARSIGLVDSDAPPSLGPERAASRPAPDSPPSAPVAAPPLMPLREGQAPPRWVSRREALRSPEAAGRLGGRRVDLPMPADTEYEPESREAIAAVEAGLASPECTEISCHGPDQIFARFGGRHHQVNVRFSGEEDYNAWVREMIDSAEAVIGWDEVKRRRRGVLRLADGSRLSVFMPPFTDAITFTIRKQTVVHWQADDLVSHGSMSPNMIAFLRACVAARVNILIVGQMGSGKTSTLSILSRDFRPDERIAVIEEVPEIFVAQPQVVNITYQPLQEGMGLDQALDQSLYNSFDRVIVGEVHMAGITKLLEVWMTGANGSMATYHADSAERAAERIKIALQMENPNMSAETARGMFRDAVELVVVMDRIEDRIRCTEITEIAWQQSAGQDTLGRQRIFSYQGDSFVSDHRPDEHGRVMRKIAKHGVPFSHDWFIRPVPEGMHDPRRGRR